MFKPDPKKKAHRNAHYLQFIRDEGCMVCGKYAEAHHVRRHYWMAGTGKKPHDYVTLPLCGGIGGHHDPSIEASLKVENLIIHYIVEYIKQEYNKRDLIETLMEFIEDKR
jgi:hypothetical protein